MSAPAGHGAGHAGNFGFEPSGYRAVREICTLTARLPPSMLWNDPLIVTRLIKYDPLSLKFLLHGISRPAGRFVRSQNRRLFGSADASQFVDNSRSIEKPPLRLAPLPGR